MVKSSLTQGLKLSNRKGEQKFRKEGGEEEEKEEDHHHHQGHSIDPERKEV